MSTIPSHIFKAYDIRGLVDGELSEDLAYRLGRALAVFFVEDGIDVLGKRLVVGRDMRETSPAFQAAVIRGITEQGVGVVDIGMTSTPVFNFACAHYPEYAGGVMVTASHNPAAYNGFKMTRGNGLPIGGDTGMARIRDLVLANVFPSTDRQGDTIARDVRTDYIDRIFSFVPPDRIRPMKIVVDAGNGMAGVTIPDVLARLPITVEYLYLEPDGTFPNHEANPLKTETLVDLQKKVIETGADFGFAFDGDADRIGIVDELGQVVDPSFVAALVGREVIRAHHGTNPHLLYDLRSSAIVSETWIAAGATASMCSVGHANIKKSMKETRAIFASELSLHLYFHDMYDCEATDLALLFVLAMVSREDASLSELARPLKKYAHSGEINFEVADKDAVFRRVDSIYAKKATEVLQLDGLWMRFDWGWVSVRASNTEPVLRLNLETKSDAETKARVKEFSEIMTKAD